MKYSIIYYLLILILCPMILWAQSEEKDGFKESIDIVKAYKPKITDANKLSVEQREERIETKKPVLQYSEYSQAFDMKPTSEHLPSLSIGKPRLEPLYHSLLKLGAGNYSNLFAELNYNTLRNDKMGLGIYALHNSGTGPVENSNFGDQILRLNGDRLYRHHKLSGNLSINNRRRHFYGYNHDTLELEKQDIRQDYFDLGFNGRFDNSRADSGKTRYFTEARTYFFNGSESASEFNAGLSGGIIQPHGSNQIHLTLDYDYFNYNFNEAYVRNLFRVSAWYELNIFDDKLHVKAGFNTAKATDSTESPFHFYPKLHIEYPLAEYNLKIYGGLRGNLQVNTFRDLSYENEFLQVNRALDLRNTNNTFEVYAGAEGNISDRLNYNAAVHYQNLENLHFFLNDTADQSMFSVVYDVDNTVLFRLKGSLNYRYSSKLQAGASFEYLNYDVSGLDFAIHRPSLLYSIHGIYSLKDKIRFRLELHGFDSRKTLAITSSENSGIPQIEEVKLPGYADLNLGVSYKFSRGISAFIDFKNVLADTYEFYYLYQNRGFQVNAGLILDLY